MSVAGTTLSGAASGAGTGAVVGSIVPGFGTAAGAIVGGLVGGVGGYLSSAGGHGGVATSGGTADAGVASNFSYGSHNNQTPYADQAAAAAGAQGSAFINGAAAAQGIQGPQIYGNAQDRQAMLGALGGTAGAAGQIGGAAGSLGANANYLQQLGMQPTNTNIAAQQLQQGENANMQQSLALARSGRSLGSGAAALQNAQFQNAQGGQATNQQAAIANLQEQQQNRQLQLSALGAAQQGYGAQAGAYGSQASAYGAAGAQASGLNTADTGLQQQNAQNILSQEGLNNQLSGTYLQGGLSEQGLQNQILTTQLGANEQYQNSIEGNSIAQQGLNNQQTGEFLAAGSGLAGAAATYYGDQAKASDRDVKQGIMPAGAVPNPSDPANPGGFATYNSHTGATTAYQPPAAQAPTPSLWDAMSAGARTNANAQTNWQPPPAPLQSSNYAGGVVPTTGINTAQPTPPPAPLIDAPAAAPSPQNGYGTHVNTGSGYVGPGYGTHVASDVTNKTDIKAADGQDATPWYRHALLADLLGYGSKSAASNQSNPFNPGALVRDPHNPSQMVSPYASIGAASNGAMGLQANGQAMGRAMQAADSPDARARASIAQLNSFAPATQDTWGGQATPAPADPALAAQLAAASNQPTAMSAPATPYPFVQSDVHSKAAISQLSEQNRSLAAALAATRPPTQGMLNQAGADQAAYQQRLQYPQSANGAGPSMAMLNQAAADQDGAPVPAPDRPAIDLRPAMPYSYEYKDPQRHGQGRFFGPMAQDLEKTPAGASVVKKAPDGTKMVDTSRLSLVNTGAISDLQRQVQALGGRPSQSPTNLSAPPDQSVYLAAGDPVAKYQSYLQDQYAAPVNQYQSYLQGRR